MRYPLFCRFLAGLLQVVCRLFAGHLQPFSLKFRGLKKKTRDGFTNGRTGRTDRSRDAWMNVRYIDRICCLFQIQDLYGKVNFTEAEITAMQKELAKYGLELPAFSKIGGILASEMPVDEAALHAAIIAINEAVDLGE